RLAPRLAPRRVQVQTRLPRPVHRQRAARTRRVHRGGPAVTTPEALVAIAELHQALGRPPLNGGIGEYEFGPWKVRLNGAGEDQDGIPPFTASIEFNGWPAGLIDPAGGVIAAGE